MIQAVIDILQSKHLSIGISESMTGGFLASRFVSIQGVSTIFKGSLICYHTDIKVRVLGVEQAHIQTYGVVSKEVAVEMVRKTESLFTCDLSISITGYAESPSYAYVAIKYKEIEQSIHLTYPNATRIQAIEHVSEEAIQLLHKVLLSL